MKKGFTLVEIMVVVIIMGVLAAVGVPKLFGLIAKARAAEVPVAAGTYVSLQNAYLGENNGIGSWKNIGYGAPGDGQTEYFEYSGCINGTIPFANMEPDMPGWQASNRSGLNSCQTGSAWAIIIDPAGEREIEYRKIITSAECAALTSSWGSVGETVEGMCETTGELHVAGTENKTPEKPETPTTPEETPADPVENPTPQQDQTTTENPEPKQGDCDALAESMKGKGADKGNKYGWVCVSACGVFAPPGKARNAGFDTGTLQKKKDTGGDCKKVEPESNTGSSGTNQGSSGSTSNSEVQGSGGPQSGGGTTSTEGEGEKTEESVTFPGYKGDGDPHDFDADKDVCLKYNESDASKCEEWDDKEGYEGCTGTGCPHKYDATKDACLKKTSGKCEEWGDKEGYYCMQPVDGGGCEGWQPKSDFPGWAGSGIPHEYNSSIDYCFGTESGSTCNGNYQPKSDFPYWAGLGLPHDYNSNIDFCLEGGNGNNPCTKWRPSSECSDWQNKNKCNKWKTAP